MAFQLLPLCNQAVGIRLLLDFRRYNDPDLLLHPFCLVLFDPYHTTWGLLCKYLVCASVRTWPHIPLIVTILIPVRAGSVSAVKYVTPHPNENRQIWAKRPKTPELLWFLTQVIKNLQDGVWSGRGQSADPADAGKVAGRITAGHTTKKKTVVGAIGGAGYRQPATRRGGTAAHASARPACRRAQSAYRFGRHRCRTQSGGEGRMEACTRPLPSPGVKSATMQTCQVWIQPGVGHSDGATVRRGRITPPPGPLRSQKPRRTVQAGANMSRTVSKDPRTVCTPETVFGTPNRFSSSAVNGPIDTVRIPRSPESTRSRG